MSLPDRAPKRLLLQRPALAAVSVAEDVCLGIVYAGSGLTREKADNQKGGGHICYRPFATSLLKRPLSNILYHRLKEVILTQPLFMLFCESGVDKIGDFFNYLF
jgi:hypothetical protein